MSYGIQAALEQMQALANQGQVQQAVDLGAGAAASYNANPAPAAAHSGLNVYYEENPAVAQQLQAYDAANTGVNWGPVANQQAAPWQTGQFAPTTQLPTGANTPRPPTAGVQPVPNTPKPPTTTTPPGALPPAAPQPGQAPTTVLPGASTTQDILREFLESDPYLILNHSLNSLRKRGTSMMFQQWFAQNFNRFLGEYQGMVAEQALQGVIPTVSFIDFVLGMNPDTQFAASASPSTPGTQSQRYSDFLRQKAA